MYVLVIFCCWDKHRNQSNTEKSLFGPQLQWIGVCHDRQAVHLVSGIVAGAGSRESKMEAGGTFSSPSYLLLPSRPHLLNLNLL